MIDEAIAWPDPTPEMLNDPIFNAIWSVIKTWDVNVPGAYIGYCGATGNHARAILDGLHAILPDLVRAEREACISVVNRFDAGGDCVHNRGTEPDTGAGLCSLEDRDGYCICGEVNDVLLKVTRAIRARNEGE